MVGINKPCLFFLFPTKVQNSSTSKSGKQKLISHEFDSARGLTVSASAVFFDSKTNVISNMQNLAFSYLGAWNARPKDEIAIGFARIHKNAEGFSNEYNSELYYGIHLTD